MGIGGITYTDGRGRRRDIDAASLDDFKSRLQSFAPRQRVTPPLPQIGAQAAQTARAVETMPGASVVNTRFGLALKGEENDPTVAGRKVYSSVDGSKGFHSLDEIDPDAGGRRVGAPLACDNDDPVSDSVDGFDGESFRTPMLSRLILRVDEVTGQLTLFEYQTELMASRGRRVYGVSGESRKVVGTWFPGGSAKPEEAKFHFKFKAEYDSGDEEWSYSIGEGAVQIGGYTYFAAEGEVALDAGTQYVCAVVTLGTGAVTFAAYASTAALNTAQSDMTKYIFPLYKVVDYKVELDYRPMPNAGCWEIAESVSNGGTSGGGTGGSGTSGEGGSE